MKLLPLLLLGCIIGLASAQSLDECLQKDSISCVQRSLYKRAKEFFEKDSFELVGGVRLVKADKAERSARAGKAIVYEREINESNDVAQRQSALENFVGEEISEFITGRSLQINFIPAFEKITQSVRAFSESIPSEVRQAADAVVEGRGKKKIIRSALPLLIAAKAKIGVLATLAYFGIALVAKKAILAALISIAISAFLSVKAFWSPKSTPTVIDTTAYNSGWASSPSFGSAAWSAPIPSGGWSSNAWDEPNGAYSAQSQAYSGYHRRR